MIYDFLCKKCNVIDEVIRHHMDRDEPVICPECDSTMVRQITAPAIKVRGESIPYFHPTLGQALISIKFLNGQARDFIMDTCQANMMLYLRKNGGKMKI